MGPVSQWLVGHLGHRRVSATLPCHRYTYPGPYIDIHNNFQDYIGTLSEFRDRFRHHLWLPGLFVHFTRGIVK
jgi:hypothetical protein